MDISELISLKDNINWLKDIMPKALSNWKKSNPSCSLNPGLIKDICDFLEVDELSFQETSDLQEIFE